LEHAKEYTNLREGDYTMQIRAKNGYGIISDVATLNYEILPPWYLRISIFSLFTINSCPFIAYFRNKVKSKLERRINTTRL
jgi:hypothetical protein